MSQQEDDLRALAKIMDFLRAVSIILVVIHIYWYCYEAIQLWGINIGVVDRMLMNFQRTAGLFGSIIYVSNSMECGTLEKGMASHFSILALRTP